MTKDNNGITPLMTAAMAGHPDLVEFLCSAYDHVTLQEKIHAYEMLGCTSVDRKHNISTACEYWRKSMALRFVCVAMQTDAGVH